MDTLSRTAGGWLKLLVTFVAVAGILARAGVPLPVPSVGGPDVALAGLGAALCHDDHSGDPGAPIGLNVCNHCDMCSVEVPLQPMPAAVPAPVILAELALPAGLNPVARPRAPPERAHSPRAPPALV